MRLQANTDGAVLNLCNQDCTAFCYEVIVISTWMTVSCTEVSILPLHFLALE